VRRPSSDYLAVVGMLTEWTGGCSSGGKKNDKITKMFTPSLHIHAMSRKTCNFRHYNT